MKEELLKGLSEEQIARVKACKNIDEFMALAKEEGIELSEERLEAINGGGCFSSFKCPNCGGKDITERQVGKQHAERLWQGVDENYTLYRCKKCGHKWYGSL